MHLESASYECWLCGSPWRRLRLLAARGTRSHCGQLARIKAQGLKWWQLADMGNASDDAFWLVSSANHLACFQPDCLLVVVLPNLLACITLLASKILLAGTLPSQKSNQRLGWWCFANAFHRSEFAKCLRCPRCFLELIETRPGPTVAQDTQAMRDEALEHNEKQDRKGSLKSRTPQHWSGRQDVLNLLTLAA